MINEIPEYQKLLEEIRECKKVLNKQRRALRSAKEKFKFLETKYQFVSDIFIKGIHGKSLEHNVCKLLTSIGYQNIKVLEETDFSEDIQIELPNKLTCIEVKSFRHQNPDKDDARTVTTYRDLRRNEIKNKEIRAITILNHLNEEVNPFNRPDYFDGKNDNIAKSSSFTITTTKELLKAFILIKKKELTFEDFDKIFHTPGIVKFSKNFIKKCLSNP